MSEFMGTAMLLLLGAGVCANLNLNKSKAHGAGWLTVNFGWGLAVFSGVLVAFKTGGHLNPAVTLGMVAAHNPVGGALPGDSNYIGMVCIFILAQFVGAFVGAWLAYLVFFKQFNSEADPGSKLGSFATGPEVKSYGWNIVTEAIATFVLVFVVLISGYGAGATSAANPTTNMGWLNAFGVALLIVSIGASLGGPTGYAINPARDLGPRLAYATMPMKNGKDDANWSYAWVPVVGPIIGGVVAGLLFQLVRNGWPMM